MNITELQTLCGETAMAKGFHDDRPNSGPWLTNWQGNKLLLIVSEIIEAHDELRNGRDADETHYLTCFGDRPDKPEGVPSELADVVIRVLDFCYTEGINLDAMITEKLAYNATRGHKHGKTF